MSNRSPDLDKIRQAPTMTAGRRAGKTVAFTHHLRMEPCRFDDLSSKKTWQSPVVLQKTVSKTGLVKNKVSQTSPAKVNDLIWKITSLSC